MIKFNINQDISQAETMPANFYTDENVFSQTKENIFSSSWQLVECGAGVFSEDEAYPFMLLPGFMNEPLVLINNNDNQLKCMSNVCTHRGNILIEQPGKSKSIVCAYHGRKFNNSGRFVSMPEFEEVQNFPRACDHLHQVKLQSWNQFHFVGLNCNHDLKSFFTQLEMRLGFMNVSQFRYAPELNREYLVHANWALYCDNYLEGFHVPFVHQGLNKVLDYKNYTTEIFDNFNLQIGIADNDADCFHFPESHIDKGKKIAAYYYWLFPNTMFNFYPWGLSVNIVIPLSVNKCKVSCITYVYEETKMQTGAGANLDKVEREDEAVVEAVQRGMQSRFYNTGRYSPTREKGVHHFHSLIAKSF